MVALDTPWAKRLTGTSSAVEPSLSHSTAQERSRKTFPYSPHHKTIKIPVFSLPSFLITWRSVNRGVFPSKCPIHPLRFIQQCCRLAFFTSRVTEVAITLPTLDCHYWQDEAEGAGGEGKRVLFSRNLGKWITPERNAGTQGWLEMQLWKIVGNFKLKLFQTQETESLVYLETPWDGKLLFALTWNLPPDSTCGAMLSHLILAVVSNLRNGENKTSLNTKRREAAVQLE